MIRCGTPVRLILNRNNDKMNSEDKEACQTTNDKVMKKMMMEMAEKMRKQTIKTEERALWHYYGMGFCSELCRADEVQLVMLYEKDHKDLCDETDDVQELYRF